MNDEKERIPCKCLRCGHVWFKRVNTPLKCARCNNKLWNIPRKRKRGRKPKVA